MSRTNLLVIWALIGLLAVIGVAWAMGVPMPWQGQPVTTEQLADEQPAELTEIDVRVNEPVPAPTGGDPLDRGGLPPNKAY